MARNLRRTLYVLSVVPIAAGVQSVLLGVDSVPSPGDPSANLDSEFRFYSVWYIGAGLFLIWLARRVEERTLELRVFFGLLFLTGLSRILSAIDMDWPSTGQLVLMGFELVLPIIFVTWQARVAR